MLSEIWRRKSYGEFPLSQVATLSNLVSPLKRSLLLKKEFAPTGSKFFLLFIVDSFLEGVVVKESK